MRNASHIDIYIDGPAALQGNVYAMIRKDERGNIHQSFPSTFGIALELARQTAKRHKIIKLGASRYIYVKYIGPELEDEHNARLKEQFPQLKDEELF